MRRAFDWKCSRITVSEIGLIIALCMRSLLRVESFHLLLNNQYILMMVTPSYVRFAKICLCQVSLLSKYSLKYLKCSTWGSCTLLVWTGGLVSHHVVNVTWTDLDLLAFYSLFLIHFWITSRFTVSVKQWLDQCP
jgi:hypothetical protein